MYCIELDTELGFKADDARRALAERGIGTRPFFLGLHEQPAAHDIGLFNGERYPVAERIARQGLYLPSGLTLTEEQVETVTTELADVVSALSMIHSAPSS